MQVEIGRDRTFREGFHKDNRLNINKFDVLSSKHIKRLICSPTNSIGVVKYCRST